MHINPEVLHLLQERYISGTRVELVQMHIPNPKLQPGAKGTVTLVDSLGTIHVDWDRGSSLGVVYGKDICRKLGASVFK